MARRGALETDCIGGRSDSTAGKAVSTRAPAPSDTCPPCPPMTACLASPRSSPTGCAYMCWCVLVFV